MYVCQNKGEKLGTGIVDFKQRPVSLKAINSLNNVKIGDICLYAALLMPIYQLNEKNACLNEKY